MQDQRENQRRDVPVPLSMDTSHSFASKGMPACVHWPSGSSGGPPNSIPMPTPFVAQPGMTMDESFPVRDGRVEIWQDRTPHPGGHEWAVVLTHTTVRGPAVLWHGNTRDTAAIVAGVLKRLLYEQGHEPDPLESEGQTEVSMWRSRKIDRVTG